MIQIGSPESQRFRGSQTSLFILRFESDLRMRIGIFGGTFDPIHFGHLLLAEQCREQCQLDEVWFLPAKIPPHKREKTITDEKSRVEMIEFAIAGHVQFRVEKIELERESVSYTVETLQELKQRDTDHEFFLLIGVDSLLEFQTWREPERIRELATLVAVNRDSTGSVEEESLRQSLGEEFFSRLKLVNIPDIALSSTDIRNRIRRGKSIRFMTPRAVETYIEQHNLYSEQ